MTYPTNSLSLSLEDVDRQVVRLKQQCTQWLIQLNSTIDAPVVINMFARLRAERNALTAAAATPGIGAYAQAQKGDDQLDIATEFNAMVAAIDAAANWISTNAPKDGNGYLLLSQFGINGLTHRQFTAQQLGGLRTLVQAISDTIE